MTTSIVRSDIRRPFFRCLFSAMLWAALLAAPAAGQVFGPPGVLSNTVPSSDLADDQDPQVATGGGGNWVAVWVGTNEGDRDIQVSRSTDSGATWSAPARLDPNSASDDREDFAPQVATDGAGNWVAVWQSEEDNGDDGSDADIFVSRSTDNGATWTPPSAINSSAGSDNDVDDVNPQVATDGGGNWVAVWVSNNELGGTIGTDWDILISRSTNNGATWSTPAALNSNAASDSGDDYTPRVTSNAAGDWVVVWSSADSLGGTIGSDRDILVSRSTNNGVTWSAPAALNTNAASDSGGDWFPQVAAGVGYWVAVWESADSLGGTIGTDSDVLFSRSTDSGVTWSAPAALNSDAASDSEGDWAPHVAADGAGNCVAVWESKIGTDRDIFVSRSIDNGVSWSALTALNSNAASDSGPDWVPRVAAGGGGDWVTVWESEDSLGGLIGTDGDILFSRSTDNGVSWSAVVPLNSNAAASTADVAPQLTTDGGGNWVAVWESEDSLGGTIGEDRDILVSRSTDNGATWSPPAALNANAASDSGDDYAPQLTTDGAGNWVAVWWSEDSLGGVIGTDPDILVSRSTDNGATWSTPAALNANAASDSGGDFRPQVATSGGYWVAVWDSTDSLGGIIGTDTDILVSRSTDNGATWSAPAALNTNAASDSGYDSAPQVTTDGTGNWVAVWRSWDDLGGTIGTDTDILVSRSSDNGATWSAPVALNTNAPSDSGGDADPQVTTDGAGNWVAVWQSDDSLGGTIGTDSDILVSRSTDNGATWSAPAALNTNATSDSGGDADPQVTTDGAGNWVAAWESDDDLGGTIGTDTDILVSRSTDNGATWTAPAALNANASGDSKTDLIPQVTTDGAGNWVAVWGTSGEVSYARGAICGDGDVGGLEECDDANLSDGDGCDSNCTFTACGNGIVTGGEDCDDGNLTNGDCCSSTCLFETGGCDDGSPCTGGDLCSGGSCVGTAMVAPSCRTAGKSALLIVQNADDSKDKLLWKWVKGQQTSQAEFSDPTVSASYTLCVYVGTAAALLLEAEVPSSATKWSSISTKGYKYDDPTLAEDGIQKMILKGSTKDTAKALAKGKGENLPDPALPLPFVGDVTAQLHNSDTGLCFGSNFGGAQILLNDATKGKFKAKAP